MNPNSAGRRRSKSPLGRTGLVLALVVVGLLFGSITTGLASEGPKAAQTPAERPYSHEPKVLFTPTERIAQLLQHRLTTTQLVAASGPLSSYLPSAVWLAYAHWDQSFYVAVPPSSVDVIAALNESVSAVIPVGAAPFAVAVDEATQEVFVTNTGSDNVSVINGTSQVDLGSIAVQNAPEGLALNSTSGTLYVADNGSNNVSVIAVNSLSVVATVAVGESPLGVAWDPATGKVFVADRGSDEVSVVAGSAPSVVGTVSVGSEPYGVAIDSRTDNVYVTNQGSSNVSVISAVGDSLNATVPVLYPGLYGGIDLQGIAYDGTDGLMWVGGGYFVAVVIDPVNESVVDYISPDPSGVAFDPDSGNICLTNTANSTFSCYVFAYDPNATTTITFSQSGLPVSTLWNVTLTPSSGEAVTGASSSATTIFGVFKGEWQPIPFNDSFAIPAISGYTPFPATGTVASSNGSPVLVNVTFANPQGPFLVKFTESGLPRGTTWAVTLGSATMHSSANTISFLEPNGTYAYQIADIPGWHQTTSPYAGSVVVDGAWVIESTLSFRPVLYPMTFTETGLPDGTVWWVNVTGGPSTEAAGSDLSWDQPNGTLAYSVASDAPYTASPSNGSIDVDGVSVTQSVSFTLVAHYNVSFAETGLPSGTVWLVTLTGTSWISVASSAASVIIFSEFNGTYPYSLGPVAGYQPNPDSGSVRVHGGGVAIAISFRAATNPFTVRSVAVGDRPEVAAFDSGNGWIYVPNNRSNNVSVINGTTVVASIPVGTGPDAAAYDAGNGYVYVLNAGSNDVTVIDGTQVIATVGVGSNPSSATFDSRNGYVYVANQLSANVSVILGTAVVASVTVGTWPMAQALNGINGYLYVANDASNNVSVISGTTVLQSVALGGQPWSETWDPQNGYVYVVDEDATVNVIEGTTVLTTIAALGDGWSHVVYDWANGYVYVPSPDSANMSVINGTTLIGSVPLGAGATAATYDDGFGYLAVASGSQVEMVLGLAVVASVNVGTYPDSELYDTYNGNVYVSDYGSSNVSVISPASYTVTFAETGLPSGTTWNASIAGATIAGNGTTLAFEEIPNGTYGFTAASSGFQASPPNGTITVAGANVTVAVAFAMATFSPTTYRLAFFEATLPSGTNWSVALSSLTKGVTIEVETELLRWSDGGATIVFQASNGTFVYSAAAPGYGTATQTVIVSGSPPPTVTINFVPVSTAPPAGTGGLSEASLRVLLGSIALGGAVVAIGLVLMADRSREKRKEAGRRLVARLSDEGWALDEEPRAGPKR